MSVLGERLKKTRIDKGLSQIEAAKLLGISNGTLSGYERSYRDPDTHTLEKIADFFGVTTDYLLGRTDEPKSYMEELQAANEAHDMNKQLELFQAKLKNADNLTFNGEPMSEEAKEVLLEALEHAERIATLANKKYTPNKFRDKEKGRG